MGLAAGRLGKFAIGGLMNSGPHVLCGENGSVGSSLSDTPMSVLSLRGDMGDPGCSVMNLVGILVPGRRAPSRVSWKILDEDYPPQRNRVRTLLED
jgi:hypothetical protein